MKKYIAGFVAGALFVLSTTAFADTISMIGKKIQGETPVIMNGTKLDTAIVVDGKSYAPVRKISEAAGYSVSVDGKSILLSSPEQTNSSAPVSPTKPTGGSVVVPEETNNTPVVTKRSTMAVEGDIKNVKDVITSDKMALKLYEEKLKSNPDKAYQEKIDLLNKSIADNEAKLKELETELVNSQK